MPSTAQYTKIIHAFDDAGSTLIIFARPLLPLETHNIDARLPSARCGLVSFLGPRPLGPEESQHRPVRAGRQFELLPHRGRLSYMLFMVIERFRHGNPRLVGQRFKQRGRILPKGVFYHASWVDSAGTRCFQIMETEDPELLDAWAHTWDDLIEFEIVPVETSADFWAQTRIE